MEPSFLRLSSLVTPDRIVRQALTQDLLLLAAGGAALAMCTAAGRCKVDSSDQRQEKLPGSQAWARLVASAAPECFLQVSAQAVITVAVQQVISVFLPIVASRLIEFCLFSDGKHFWLSTLFGLAQVAQPRKLLDETSRGKFKLERIQVQTRGRFLRLRVLQQPRARAANASCDVSMRLATEDHF